MSLKAALLFLLQNLGQGKRSVIVSFQQMLMWENAVLPILLEEGLLVEAELATTLPCYCGDKDCLMNVIPIEGSDEFTGSLQVVWYFGICGKSRDKPIMAKLKNFYSHQLKQWQLTNEMLIDWLIKYLRLEPPKEANRAGVIQIGTATLNGENYALALGTADELVLLVNGNAVLMTELLSVSEGGTIEMDTDLIEVHKFSKTVEITPANKPPSAKQQVNQTETQKRQTGWQKLYRQQLQQHPEKSKTWHSEQIAKSIAEKGEKPVSAKHIYKYLKP